MNDSLHRPTCPAGRGRIYGVRLARRVAAAAVLLAASGCVVPQPRGEGRLERIIEPTTKRGYWLYLPEEYLEADDATRQTRRWPLVVTFHGMKPFDSARPQALEWEQEADRYGYIVIAPELRAPSVLRQFPVRTVGPAFNSDEEATLAILDHVFATTYADPGNVLSTSWSSGGYTAHYMLNRHPNRFTCLAVRQSNFSASILDSAKVARSRYHPILILTTQNDFAGVKRESKEAIEWYERHEYANFAWVEIKRLGHERTPDTAAAFFGRVAEVGPNRPPVVLARRQAIAGNRQGLALLARGLERPPPAPAGASAEESSYATAIPPVRPRSTVLVARPPARDTSIAVRGRPQHSAYRMAGTPARVTPQRKPAYPRSPVSIGVSSAIGTEPLVLSFRAVCPADWCLNDNADFLWTLNGDPICSGVNGQKTVTQPGEHTLGLLVVTRDGQEHRAFRRIRVLPQPRADSAWRPPDAKLP